MNKLFLIGAIVIAMLIVSGFYNPGDADEIHGCFKGKNGQLRVISSYSECLNSEHPITLEDVTLKLSDVIVGTWNIQNYNY